MASRKRRSVAKRPASTRRASARLHDLVARITLDMEEPLRHATQFLRVIELAEHAPDEEYQSVALVAVEARSNLETVQGLWRELRDGACPEHVTNRRNRPTKPPIPSC